MIKTTRQLKKDLDRLPVETFLLVTDENDNEYMVEGIIQRKLHGDSDRDWCYALKLIPAGNGCIKRRA